ncbi:hypothetical protein VOI54_06545 [Tamlana sp. 2201CG12-4]|uniref:hypothetical protein n=1 Tax=Tamlana sp. 2201CG12-4 TaxID=3112582 RepID=UPI002DB56041|nr:hypothetical protein [Tamlana sp. 2201CG12-4]MEC3906670.1 hypothetical protein [Tamlana sp. 2201CG12-4]
MKKLILLFVSLSFIISTFGQTKMKITLNDGSVKQGEYWVKMQHLGVPIKPRIKSSNSKEKYKLEEIENVIMYDGIDSIKFKVIDAKKYLNSKKIEKKLGRIDYIGDKIQLYNVYELLYQGGAIGLSTTVDSYGEKYVKRTEDNIAYNMGYIYGAGQRGIKKRVRDYFIDCPELIEKVNNNEIPKHETKKIVLFYEESCGK